jgi:hypothetical protein
MNIFYYVREKLIYEKDFGGGSGFSTSFIMW